MINVGKWSSEGPYDRSQAGSDPGSDIRENHGFFPGSPGLRPPLTEKHEFFLDARVFLILT